MKIMTENVGDKNDIKRRIMRGEDMDDSAIDWFANNPYCIAIMCILGVVCLIVFILDVWHKK